MIGAWCEIAPASLRSRVVCLDANGRHRFEHLLLEKREAHLQLGEMRGGTGEMKVRLGEMRTKLSEIAIRRAPQEGERRTAAGLQSVEQFNSCDDSGRKAMPSTV